MYSKTNLLNAIFLLVFAVIIIGMIVFLNSCKGSTAPQPDPEYIVETNVAGDIIGLDDPAQWTPRILTDLSGTCFSTGIRPAYPNATTANMNFDIHLNEPAKVRIGYFALWNVRPIYESSEILCAGSHTITIDVSGYSKDGVLRVVYWIGNIEGFGLVDIN